MYVPAIGLSSGFASEADTSVMPATRGPATPAPRNNNKLLMPWGASGSVACRKPCVKAPQQWQAQCRLCSCGSSSKRRALLNKGSPGISTSPGPETSSTIGSAFESPSSIIAASSKAILGQSPQPRGAPGQAGPAQRAPERRARRRLVLAAGWPLSTHAHQSCSAIPAPLQLVSRSSEAWMLQSCIGASRDEQAQKPCQDKTCVVSKETGAESYSGAGAVCNIQHRLSLC